MSVFRVNRTKNFVVLNNTFLRDTRLSLKAKGLLAEMLALPDDWNYTIAGLVAINKEKTNAIETALRELKECGYLVVTKCFPHETASGRMEYRYDIYEEPHLDSENQPLEFQEVEKQGVENQPLEFLGVENQGQQNIYNKECITKDVLQNATVSNTSSKSNIATEVNTATYAKSNRKKGESLADVASIILIGNEEWRPTESYYSELVKAYPNVNVAEQFGIMRAWTLSNPEKRKTRRGATRFVNNWLSNASKPRSHQLYSQKLPQYMKDQGKPSNQPKISSEKLEQIREELKKPEDQQDFGRFAGIKH